MQIRKLLQKGTLARQLFRWFLLVALLALAATAVVSYHIAAAALQREVTTGLAALLDAKINLIEAYVREREKDVTTLARNPAVIDAMRRFDDAFRQGGLDSATYRTAEAAYRPFLE
jgi:C4-dicarboxylate-specific signal transduction histidine kinase